MPGGGGPGPPLPNLKQVLGLGLPPLPSPSPSPSLLTAVRFCFSRFLFFSFFSLLFLGGRRGGERGGGGGILWYPLPEARVVNAAPSLMADLQSVAGRAWKDELARDLALLRHEMGPRLRTVMVRATEGWETVRFYVPAKAGGTPLAH